MEPEPSSSAAPSRETTELRFFVPNEVAEWLAKRGREHFQNRNEYIRALLVQAYRKGNGQQ